MGKMTIENREYHFVPSITCSECRKQRIMNGNQQMKSVAIMRAIFLLIVLSFLTLFADLMVRKSMNP